MQSSDSEGKKRGIKTVKLVLMVIQEFFFFFFQLGEKFSEELLLLDGRKLTRKKYRKKPTINA